MSRKVDEETEARAEEIVREEGQPHGRDADHRGRGTAALDKSDEGVVRANEAAQDEVGGGAKPDPDREARTEALGSRLKSTASAERALKPLSQSNSGDTSESGSSNRYAKG
jgi:hypothetical protein